MLFPGTGFPSDLGGPDAEGSAVNVALPPGTADAGWLRAFHAVVPPLLREFAPEVLVTQHGCDSHIEDPLAHLMLTVDGQRAAYLALHDLAHEVAAAGGWPPAAAATRWSRSCRGPGPTCSPSSAAARWTRRPRRPEGVARHVRERLGADRAVPPHRRPHPGLPGLARGLRPRHLAGPGDPRDPDRRSSRCTASTRCPETARRDQSKMREVKATRRRLPQFL